MRESIEELARHIQSREHLEDAEKEELLEMLGRIEEEIDPESSEQLEPVRESVKLASTVEDQSIPEQLEERLLELEASHPQVAATLGRIAHALSRMGI